MGWIVEIGAGSWPASSAAIGVGVCVFFVWCWLSTRNHRFRLEIIALLGFSGVAAFLGGLLLPWLVGESGLSSLGALMGAGLVLLALPLRTGLDRWRAADHLVPAGIAGLSVARLGCLFEGCDFGKVTGGDWGVVHEAGTRAFDAHVIFYQMSPFEAGSLSVHPFALYLALWGIAAAGVGEWRRSKGDGPGASAMLAAAVFFFGGAVIEFFREPQMVHQVVDGVSVYPVLYFGGALVAIMLRRRAIRRAQRSPRE